MNVENLKSELQQVLDNDVVLRKEFNELKRSLSDYRNQLIMRDEDCKRLQVTIDVLNTKLVVMERDNTTYKSELTSFKELRGSIKEQLDAKQEEIDARLEEIQQLKNDLTSITNEYESRIERIKLEAAEELQRVTENYSEQIAELKTNTHYKETGIKDEYENRLSQLSMGWADQEQSLKLNHEEEISALKKTHEDFIFTLRETHNNELSELKNSGNLEFENLKEAHRYRVESLQNEFDQKLSELGSAHQSEVLLLKSALEEQRITLTTNFNATLEHLKLEFSENESRLKVDYETQIAELKSLTSSNSEELTTCFQSQITELKEQHGSYVLELTNGYEAKLSNTLIHSTSQNSKLMGELEKMQVENDQLKEKIHGLVVHVDSQGTDIESLTLQLTSLQQLLTLETNKFSELTLEYENFKQNATLTSSEQVKELNTHIDNITISNAEVVTQLNAQISGLSEELKNLGLVFENTTNTLSETEIAFELKIQELEQAALQIEELNTTSESAQTIISEKEQELDTFKRELEYSVQQVIEAKEVEYQKLLVENASIISEIDLVQDKLEAREAEITILKGELEEVKMHSAGKVEHFKEILANKNFQITNLEANNAALNEELTLLKRELAETQNQLVNAAKNEDFEALQTSFDLLSNEKLGLLSEIQSLQSGISSLNETVLGLNEKILTYENELVSLKDSSKLEEQEAFIDRLFKQIDGLNDERMTLLDEKEQMANQLLKMNDTVGLLSQHVESENIDVTDLNNHRKNVILANNLSATNEKSHLKGQINDLVREIDKCIALLSA